MVHSRLAAGKPIRPGLNWTVAPTLNLWPDTLWPDTSHSLPHARALPACRRERPPVHILATALLRFLDLTGLLAATAPVVFENKGHPIALVQGADAGLLERRGMDEHVLAAVLRLDEAITLGRVEKLHRTSDAHVGIPFPKKAWIGRSCVGPHARPCISDVGRQTALWASSKTAILRTYPQIGVHRLRGYMGQDRGGSKANRAKAAAAVAAGTAMRTAIRV